MISNESTELDNKVIRGADEDNHKDSGNKSCAAESSDSFLSCSERESMTTNQDANNQEIEARNLLAIKLKSNESDTKNEECDKAYKSDEGSITRENINIAITSSDKGSIEIDEFGDLNDDSLRGTSFTISNLGNNDFSKEKDDISHNGRSFSINDVVNLIREVVSQILTTPTRDDSSNTQSVTNDIVQDEEPPKTNHTDGREKNSTNSLYESLRHRDSQLETTNFVANNTITKSKFKPPKSKNWSKLKKLILLKRSIKVLERARKVNPQPLNFCPEPAPYTIIQSFAARLRQKSG
ncbi:hypothetical protein R3W88_008504 [Solanum pinnatisectum]|uniref:Uncharacterized protein n=1 Tax=Solanum pinnatisectum TaxID=50273 RepID=A0AAV9M872_9SOLN|nr:hypothetical protein R3W88_008504 [Solanum pinnatisectum]